MKGAMDHTSNHISHSLRPSKLSFTRPVDPPVLICVEGIETLGF